MLPESKKKKKKWDGYKEKQPPYNRGGACARVSDLSYQFPMSGLHWTLMEPDTDEPRESSKKTDCVNMADPHRFTSTCLSPLET